ncbi:hypothetical protein STVA_17670 [Allostella vacuolata]|nr:hypothetical protein STVA_17670 [Stella vacuolata]
MMTYTLMAIGFSLKMAWEYVHEGRIEPMTAYEATVYTLAVASYG